MIISFNTGKINTNNSGGLLQQKRVEVTGNGLDVVVPDAGYDGLSTVYIKTNVEGGGGSYKDFSVIGYDDETGIMLNNEIDDDIAYSKSLYDAWNPNKNSTESLYLNNTKLVYAPAIDTSNVVTAERMYSGCSKLKYIPQLNIAKVTKLSSMCSGCTSLNVVDISQNNGVINDLSHTFDGCTNLKTVILPTNMSSVKYCGALFNGCAQLEDVDFIDKNFKPTNCTRMFSGCKKTKQIKGLDTSLTTSAYLMFENCSSLEEIPLLSLKSAITSPFSSSSYWMDIFGNNTLPCKKMKGVIDCEHIRGWGTVSSNMFSRLTALETIERFDTINISKNGTFYLQQSTKLTVETLMVVINALYDYVSEGDIEPRKLQIGSTNLAKLSDEQKAIATNKGWTLA